MTTITNKFRQAVNGILLLDKPADVTSNGALQRVKRLFNAKKAGHTGSLDPIATGMLPLCFGEATKFSQFLLESNKSYLVTAKLGEETTTGDCEGEVVVRKPIVNVDAVRIEALMQTFLGEIEQVPPMFSAIKYQGKPLYELARQGIEIERKARRITIFSLSLMHVDVDQFTFRVHCSKGTYVRTLVEELGRGLGCGAHVTALRRIHVSPYENAVMHTLQALEEIVEQSGHAGLQECLLPVETSVQILPIVQLSAAAIFYLRMGQPVRAALPNNTSLVQLHSDDAKFLGVGEVTLDGRVKPHRLVAGL